MVFAEGLLIVPRDLCLLTKLNVIASQATEMWRSTCSHGNHDL